ncbi:hypothetical protein JRQ81_012954 [Phrynocephalus forsythii]|uniref:DUF4524 domain-containing protein n=1 Tax=Phrynocephalus forsythii TaxID=171643 RepID=A0A9Q1B3K9_9SAUR|nr:hypothetical protein JRQ81_012954 [Phrynocephalus forsythii]
MERGFPGCLSNSSLPPVAMESESIMILYEDNSVEVHYTNGSRLLLSPCGSEFLLEKAVSASAHPIQLPERVHQRTQFAISIYREQILRAIDFRNMYSSRPYLPSRIIPTERKSLDFTDIFEAKWPSPHNVEGMVSVQNGNVTISSLDNHARLFLPELQEEFTVQFLCKVSQTLPTPQPFLEKSCGKTVWDCGGRWNKSSLVKLSSKQLKIEEDANIPSKSGDDPKEDRKSSDVKKDKTLAPLETCSSEYSWVTQQIPLSSCPEEWKYPLSLVLMFHQSPISQATEPDKGNKNNENMGLDISERETSVAVTHLPLALPLSCHAPYLHRWNFNDSFQPEQEDRGHYLYSQPVKVLWSNGVIYRFFLESKSIQIYPGDGSVYKSEGCMLGKYFTRCYIEEQTKQRQETMYSVSNLPPDTPGNNYSVGAIITQALRVLLHDLENMLSLTHNHSICCWQMSPENRDGRMLPLPLGEKVIPNVGRFFAYSDNKVHAVFNDGMTLNMVWDFVSHDGKSQRSQDANIGWCKMVTPEGTQQLIPIDYPGIYERYITVVVDWCRSLKKYRDTCTVAPQPVPEPEENCRSVSAELEKIKRFNFLLENSNIPFRDTTVKRNPCSNTIKGNSQEEERLLPKVVGEQNIAETLEKTSKVISDIDSLLNSSTKQSMGKGISNNILLQ